LEAIKKRKRSLSYLSRVIVNKGHMSPFTKSNIRKKLTSLQEIGENEVVKRDDK